MENSGQSVVNPNVKFLTEILDDISSGDLRVPNFQRPYVWKPSDAISLFDSIYKGYPIGSVLFWETTQKLISFTQIGPFEIQLDDRPEINYVIDGHQRISTLFGILKSKKEIYIKEPHRWVLYFDLDKNEFFFKNASTKVSNYIAMDKIINTIDFLAECKRIQDSSPGNAEFYINKAQKLTQAIVTYKIAITQIKKGDLSSAVEIFSRLNTRGMDMTPDQMLSALTYKEGVNSFKLADKIDEIINRLIEFNFSEIERIFIFRSIIAASKKDIYNVKLEDLASDKKIDLTHIVSRCEDSIIKAVNFLRSTIRVPSDKFLPYNLQLVFLSEFFYVQPNPTLDQLDELVKWFWFTSYSGWFAGANSSKIRKGLDDLREFASNKSQQILTNSEYQSKTVEIPEKFDFRFARIKAFILFLNHLRPLPLNNEQDKLENCLAEYGSKALHNIISSEVNSYANKIIAGSVKTSFAKHEFTNNPIDKFSEKILNSHAIPIEAIQALNKNDIPYFLKLRENKIIEMEEDFIKKLGLNYQVPEIKSPKKLNQLEIFNSFD
jgi:uncharacterized protein with ParB-like and HNH nuclease domain